MIYQFPTKEKGFPDEAEEENIGVELNLTFDLPSRIAEQLEQLGITEFETCSYDPTRRIMSACVKTTLYQRGA